MSSKYSADETASAFASWSWTVCVFMSGVFFGAFISGMFLYWKSSLQAKFQALLGCLPSSSSYLRLSRHQGQPQVSKIIKESPLGREETASTYPLSPSGQEETASDLHVSPSGHQDRACALPKDFEIIKDSPLGQEDTASTYHLSPSGHEGTTSHAHLSPWGRQGSIQPKDSDIIKNSPLAHEETAAAYPLSPSGNQDTASVQPNDAEIIKDSPLGQEETASTHPPDSNIIQGSPSNQEDSTSTLLQSRPQSPQRVYKYDVFLSFSGVDTRNTFTDHLYNHLTEKGIFAFRDDKTLENGKPFPSQLLEAVKDSRAAIVVFSTHYAKSTWCLEEMSTIADCDRNSVQIVLPVFYDIAPSDVRNHRGAYEKSFHSLYTDEFANNPGKVNRWKEDMTYLGKLNGFDIRNRPESTEIERITQDIIDKLDHKFPWIANHLIGMQPRIEDLERRLKLNSTDDKFRILGIWGMGGIGKTTHAKVLFNKIAYQFNASCFIEDVSKIYREGDGATEVQKIILQQTVRERNLEIYSPDRIYRTVQSRLCNKSLPKKVLIVLDDLDEQEQWDKLAIDPYLLGRGSRVIITTRNEDTLGKIADEIYEVPLLNNSDARELFLRKTFKSDISKSGEDILEYAQSLPLAIEKLGYFFNSLDEECWEEALESMRKYPNKKIMNVLQKSFEELEQYEKEIFLHIACFFGGKKEEYVKHILNSCGMSGHRHAIRRIMNKSLITIRNQEIHMHKMLQELGKNLVRRQFPDEPALWSRLWHHEDFEDALLSEKETNNVKAIVLDKEEDVSKFSHLRIERLSKMNDLKLLILHHTNFSINDLDLLLNQVQYILWHGCPLSSISLSTWHNLVELNLPNSSIQGLWKDSQEIRNLKRLDLSYSKNLRQTPNFKFCQGLVWLDFTGCTNLMRVDESIGLLEKLDYLSLRDCSSLVVLDLGSNCKLSSLRVLCLSGCTSLEKTPDFTGLSNLSYLDVERCTSLSTVHESIGALATLEYLSLRGCTNLAEIPMNVYNMASLQLDLSNCTKLKNRRPRRRVISSSCLEELRMLLEK